MNPFDAPPSTPAVSYEPPQGPKRSRGRLVGAGLVGAGLVGAAAFGVSALVSADDPGLGTSPTTTLDDDPSEDTTVGTDDASTDLELDDGTLTIGPGTGDPWTIDLGELDPDDLRELQACVGLPALGGLEGPVGEWDGELPPLGELFGDLGVQLGEDGELPDFGVLLDEWFGEWDGELPPLDELFGDLAGEPGEPPEFDGELPDVEAMLDDLVTVMGPDGPVIVDLGDDDGTVTIERDGDTGEITITTEGSATEVELGDLLSEVVGAIELPPIPAEMQTCLDALGD